MLVYKNQERGMFKTIFSFLFLSVFFFFANSIRRSFLFIWQSTMRLQKIILGILLILTCLTIFTRGQEIFSGFKESETTPLPSTESIEIEWNPLFEFGTGEVIGTGRGTGELPVPSVESGQEFTGDMLFSWSLVWNTSLFTGEQSWWVETKIINLIISEVFYDGTDEWIEISNISNNSFSGTIQITGSVFISTAISLTWNQSIILIKPSGNYSRIDLTVPRITTTTFSLTDTKAMSLVLSESGQMLDIFAIETGRMTKLDNKKTSFQKMLISDQQIITWVVFPLNVIDPYIANPGFIYKENWPNQSESRTGSAIDNTGQIDSGENIHIPTWPLKITEIADSIWQFSQFVELQATEDWEWSLIISGSLIKENFFLGTKLNKWDLLIISKSDNWWLSTQNIIENNRLELQKSGFLSIYGQSGQVFDSIYILSTYPERSLYYWWISQSGSRVFDKIALFSPGFDESLWWYFSSINTGISTISDNISPSIPSITTGELSNSVLVPEPGLLQIQGLVFKTPESITISSLWTGSIDLWDRKRYLLTRATGKTEWGKTKKYLTGLLFSGQNITISKTFWFLDGGGCVSLWYSGSLHDSYCYAAPTKITETTSKEIVFFDGSITIISLNAKTPESITLKSSLSTSVNLSDKNRYLRTKSTESGERWSTKKYLDWVILPGENLTISKTFGFLDKGACVSLWYIDKQYDMYCYSSDPKVFTWEILTGQLTWLEIPKVSLISLLPNPSGKDTQESIILSAQADYPITGFFLKVWSKKITIKNPLLSWENLITWSLWLVNKAACVQVRRSTHLLDQFCYTNPKEDQRFGQTNTILQEIAQSDFSLISKVNFVVKGNQICTSYQDQILSCRSLPSSKTSIKLKNENKLYKTYTNLLETYLRKNRSTLFYSTTIKEYFAVLSQAKKAINNFESTIVISGQQIDVQDIATQIALKTNTGYVESRNENSIPQRILWVQKLWRRSASLWHRRSNFFSVSRNWDTVYWGSRCYANAILDRQKPQMIIDRWTNSKTFFCWKPWTKMA